MLSLGCERLQTPIKIKRKKVLDHYLHHDLGMLQLLWWFFAHLLILQYPDHHQNLISSSLYYSGPLHKISSQSVHNFLSNVVHRQTDKQTDRLTNATENITSFAKEVITLRPTSLHLCLMSNGLMLSFSPADRRAQWLASDNSCFAHLLILQYPDHHQNLISSYLYYSGPVDKISSQSVHNFLSNVAHRQTDKQTDRQTDKLTNATKNITSFAEEVTMVSV